MKGIVAFDGIAKEYDEAFTRSLIGQAQRERIYALTEPWLPTRGSRVLEINAGTGEDACWLATKGMTVVATDLSPMMIAQAEAKVQSMGLEPQVKCRVYGFEHLKQLNEAPFHLVFSNFAGLNCADPETVQELGDTLTALTQPGAYIVAVVMGKYCLWETAYFLAKGKPGNAFRRWRKRESQARLNASNYQPTWYYSLQDWKELWPRWQIVAQAPVGWLIPPSYLEKNFGKLAPGLSNWESRLKKLGMPGSLADHHFIVFRRQT